MGFLSRLWKGIDTGAASLTKLGGWLLGTGFGGVVYTWIEGGGIGGDLEPLTPLFLALLTALGVGTGAAGLRDMGRKPGGR